MFVLDPRGHTAIHKLLEKAGASCLRETLECGDILFTNEEIWVGIELKEVDDLLSSFRSGRLFEQLATMINSYDVTILLIYGFLGWSREGVLRTTGGLKPSPPWPNLKMLNGGLLSLQNNGVIVPLIMQNEQDVANYIMQCQEWYEKKEHGALLNRSKAFAFGSTDQLHALHIVTGIPKVGGAIAKRLLAHFGSPYGVINATEEELLQVPGIGKKLSNRIYTAVRSKWNG